MTGFATRFEIQHKLGAGGFGVVYRAYDRQQRMTVALKTLRDPGAGSVARLKREFRSLADVAHPNLLPLYELVADDAACFFTMELIEGQTFIDWVRAGRRPKVAWRAHTSTGTALDQSSTFAVVELERVQSGRFPTGGTGCTAVGARDLFLEAQAPPFDEQRLRSCLAQLAEGLVALHEAGKLHRDIKPSNVLVAADGRLVLLDFGLVTELFAEDLGHARFAGTPAYAAPEQAGDQATPASDWYAVGAMLHEALLGVLPFSGAGADVLVLKQQFDPTHPGELLAGLPADLADLCFDLLQRDPDARPSGADVLERLQAGGRARARAERAPTVFVGRQQQLVALERAVHDRRGALVTGPSGVGKSALVQQLVQNLAQQGTRVFAGRCYQRESVPFKAFDGVVDSIAQELSAWARADRERVLPPQLADELGGLFPVLFELAFGDGARETTPRERKRATAFAAFATLLGALAASGPCVVVIDDLQWADSDSLALLTELLRGNENAATVVLSARSADASASEQPDAFARALSALGAALRVELPPLGAAESRELVQRLVEDQAPEAAERIAHAAGGHPLFIRELVLHGTARQEVDLDATLRARVGRLERAQRVLVELLAVAAEPVSAGVLAQAATVDQVIAARCLRELTTGHLVRASAIRGGAGVEPYHDRVREAVFAGLDVDTVHTHHSALASASLTQGWTELRPEFVVRHLAASGQRTRAAALAAEAADRAAGASAFERAAGLYRSALELGQLQGAERRRATLALGDALSHAARGQEAASAFLTAADGATAQEARVCRQRAAEQLLISGHIERGLEVLRELLEEHDEPLPPTTTGTFSQLALELGRARVRGLKWKRSEPLPADDEKLFRFGLLRSAAYGLGMVDNGRAALYHVRLLRLALDIGDPDLVGRAVGAEAIFEGSHLSGSRRAWSLAREARRIADREDRPVLHGWAEGAQGVLEVLAGRFGPGADTLAAAEDIFENQTSGTTWELDSVRLFRSLGLKLAGDFVRLPEAVRRYADNGRRRDDRYLEVTVRRGGNVIYLAADDPDGAERDLTDTYWPEWRMGSFHIQHFWELEAQCERALYIGDGASAFERHQPQFHAMSRSMNAVIEVLRCLNWWLRGRVLVARAEAGIETLASLREVRRLARLLTLSRCGYARAWASWLRAGEAAVRGDAKLARRWIERSVPPAQASDMLLAVALAELRLGQLDGGVEGSGRQRRASEQLRALGVVNPPALARVFSPGFETLLPT